MCSDIVHLYAITYQCILYVTASVFFAPQVYHVLCQLMYSLHHRCAMCYVSHCYSLHHRCAMCYVSHCILCTIGVPEKGYVSLFIHMLCMYINAAVAACSILYGRIGPPEVSLGSCPVGTRSGQHWKNLKIGKVSLIQILPCPPKYRTVGNFRGVLIFVDFVGPTQTTKNSLKICIDPRKYNFLGLKTTNLSLFHIMHIAMLCSYMAP